MIDIDKQIASILRVYGSIITDEERDQLYDSANDIKRVADLTIKLGAPFNVREAELLSRAAGDLNEYNFNKDGDLWKDSILKKYADHIFNYEYTYNENAHEVDPSIDLDERHIGVMAQDLEKVSPSVVQEDASGFKTVDTGHLALMNAGAIADLAREVEDIKNER